MPLLHDLVVKINIILLVVLESVFALQLRIRFLRNYSEYRGLDDCL